MTREYIRRTTSPVEMPVAGATIEATNPANNLAERQENTTARRRRIPMTMATRKLEVPEIPGFYLHWVNGEPDRVARAINAGYDFVQKDELPGYSLELGDKTGIGGDADMGDRISQIAGGTATDGQALRLYLMKLPMEFREEDLKSRDEEAEKVIQALYNDPNAHGVSGQDNDRRYVSEMSAKRGRARQPQSQSYNALEAFRKKR